MVINPALGRVVYADVTNQQGVFSSWFPVSERRSEKPIQLAGPQFTPIHHIFNLLPIFPTSSYQLSRLLVPGFIQVRLLRYHHCLTPSSIQVRLLRNHY
ncbi:hypothetical protein DPEC_G00161650 [Dallia pectoralis]|uniref:Uncharacterized protein n=1 Tax=Dallia pectoralis TaxID=75939 RepID=A0ACC2GGN8_DALPE|nr:hypothetical protein DPEC_G00161650 [Dallia pectoralis]